MNEIEYARDYGYAPASPLWLVWRGPGYEPGVHASRKEAETDAARLASRHPGSAVHILAAMANVTTSPKVVGQRFDPSRANDATTPEFAEVEPPAAPQPSAEEDQPL